MKKKISKKWLTVATLGVLLFSIACASSLEEAVENCQFALDDADYTSAVTYCQEAITADASSVEARILLSSAYAGSANIELLGIMDDIQDTQGISGKNKDFDVMRATMAAIMKDADDLGDLRNAISTLDNDTYKPTDANDDNYQSYYFQLGFLQAIESFALPTLTAQPVGEEYDSTTSPANLDADDRTSVESSMVNADDNLIKGGQGTDSSLVETVRQNFWALAGANTGTAGSTAFSLEGLRDFVKCQLDPLNTGNADDATFVPGGLGFEGVANCAVFDFTDDGDTAIQ